MPSHILGISAYFHDSAAALLCDGEIVAAAQEERFTRKKHDADFPANAVDYCLREGDIEPSQLDVVVFYEQPFVKFGRLLDTFVEFAPEGYELFRSAMPAWAQSKLHLTHLLHGEMEGVGEGFSAEITFADHHESHAASAFYPSPFQEAAVLTIDAVGEWSTTTIGHGQGNRLQLMQEIRFPHSLGMLYSAFTYYVGFKVNSGEYKLMGLAPYGTPIYRDLILDRIADLEADGSLRLDMSYFDYCSGLTITSNRFHDLFGAPPRSPESTIAQRDMDLAASIQQVCEEVVLAAANHAAQVTGSKRLVMAGGVALNCVANGRLLREGPFEKIWVQPAAGDAGGALGAALLTWHRERANPRLCRPGDSQKGSLLGPSFGSEEIGLFLDSVGAVYKKYSEDELFDLVVEMLERDEIVGWFQGRMEYGPRALGCRSILGSARSAATQRTMNKKIKFRESFRPFAPCVLREHVSEVFEVDDSTDWPYMLFVAPVRSELRSAIDEEASERLRSPDLRVRVSVPRSSVPAVTHVDYSARVQTVDAERHGRFYRMIQQYYHRTGCPVLVNTSFNVRGEPIVCTPADALRCLLATHMDGLVLEDLVLLKKDQSENLGVDVEAHRSQFALD